MNLNKNENPVTLAIILFVITTLVALMLAFTNSGTKGPVALNAEKEKTEAQQEVLKDADEFVTIETEKSDTVKEIYEGRKNGAAVGYCVVVTPVGFGGEINLVVGILPDLSITGIKITSLSETPGLGSKAAEAKFRDQFEGKNGQNGLNVIKSGTAKDNEIVAVTGATITSNAVTSGVNEAVEAVKKLK